MRLIFRPQFGRVKHLRLSRRTIFVLNALDHFFHSQNVLHAKDSSRIDQIASGQYCSQSLSREEACKHSAITAKRNSRWKLTHFLHVALLSLFSRMSQLHPAEINFERQPGKIRAVCDSEQDFRNAGGCILQ